MSSATSSLFASVALVAAGATGFVYTLAHPGVVAQMASRLLDQTGVVPPHDLAGTDAPALNMQDLPRAGSGSVSIAAGAYGHFLTEAEINGQSVDVMIDTGASLVALTYEDAENLGIFVKPSDFTYTAKTANGIARVAPITLSRVSIGDITVRNVHGVVSERGKSERTLLGMSFLGRLFRVEMRGGTLVLQE